MAETRRNNSSNWNLESFVDSLVVELDKAQDTLAVKGVNRPLTYSVKELALDLEVFPDFDGKTVRFSTAKSGETGSSKMTFQLGSITSEQIRRTTADPVGKDDISIEEIEEIDDDMKTSLRKYGITSTQDLENLEKKNVNVEDIVRRKQKSKKSSYKDLAEIINRTRRRVKKPRVSGMSLSQNTDSLLLALKGSNLTFEKKHEGFPMAMLDGEFCEVKHADHNEIQLLIQPQQLTKESHELQIALDPFAVIKMNVKPKFNKKN